MSDEERPLKLRVRKDEIGEMAILRLEGIVDVNEGEHLEEIFDSLVEKGFKSIIYDLSRVSYIASGGLQFFMVRLWGEGAKNEEVQVILSGMSAKIRIIFETLDILKFHTVAKDVDEALKMLNG